MRVKLGSEPLKKDDLGGREAGQMLQLRDFKSDQSGKPPYQGEGLSSGWNLRCRKPRWPQFCKAENRSPVGAG